jgi:hypothetical protein
MGRKRALQINLRLRMVPSAMRFRIVRVEGIVGPPDFSGKNAEVSPQTAVSLLRLRLIDCESSSADI